MSQALIEVNEIKLRQLTHKTPIAKLYGTGFIKNTRANGSNCTIFMDQKYLDEERVVSETFAAINTLTNGGYIDFLITLTVKEINGRTVGTAYAQSFRASQIVEAYANGADSDVKFRAEDRKEDDIYTVDETLAAIMLLVPSVDAPIGAAPGTPETGVTATHESADGVHYVTTLTFAALAMPAIVAAADEAHGKLLYTFPAGVHSHKVTNMDVALQGGGVVDADAPEVGIGSVIATGAVAVLATTFEDYIEGVVATDCDGTATVKMTPATAGYGTGISNNESGSVKALHLNVADGWAGADTLDATGTVTFEWTII
jgi:hypothetical protein